MKVHDFYPLNKFSSNRYHTTVLASTTFCILVEGDGFSEICIAIPKKFHYKRYVNYGYLDVSKANEFNALKDYLITEEKRISLKYGLNEKEFKLLLRNLELCLIDKYSSCSYVRKLILKGKVLLNYMV